MLFARTAVFSGTLALCALGAGCLRIGGITGVWDETPDSIAEHQPATGTSVTHCLAIGGAMKDDNAGIMKWMTNRKDTRKAVVIAYATSNFKDADTRMKARLAKHGWEGEALLLPDVLIGETERKTAAEWLPHADIIFMTGGDQSRIMQRFKAAPELRLALDEGMTRYGTPVAGSSAGAAVMSNPMFTGGASESALAGTSADDGEPDEPAKPADSKPAQQERTGVPIPSSPTAAKPAPRRGVQLGQGLGIVSPIIDTHFFQRGRVGRLVAALEASKVPYGLGIGENRAVSITGGGMCVAVGDCAALLTDGRELKREGLSRTGARVSLLSDGDRWDWPLKGTPAETAPVTVQSTRTLAAGAVLIAAPTLAAGAPAPDAWGKNVALDMLKRLAADPKTPQRARSKAGTFELVISADDRTRFGWSADKPDALTVVDARLDIIEIAQKQ